jgi:hypothetical protein
MSLPRAGLRYTMVSSAKRERFVAVDQEGKFTSGSVAKNMTLDVQILPDNQGLNGTKLQCLQGVVNTEAVPTRVQTDLIEVLLDQFFLLNKLDIRQRLRCQFDRLIEPVLASVRHIHHLDDLRPQPGIEQVALTQLRLEICTSGEHESSDIDLVVRDEVLHGVLRYFSDIVVSLLVTQTRETEGGLSSTTVLLGKVDSEFVDDIPGVAGEGAEESAVTVHNDKAEPGIRFQELGEGFGVEFVVAKVE